MQPASILKKKLASPTPVLGILVTNHLWGELIELAMLAGLDYVIIDREHFAHDVENVANACRIGRLANFPVLVRPAQTDAASIREAMDLGPCGLLLPMVESAEQLDAVQQGAFLPPRGGRRPGGHGNRWLKQFNYEDFKREVEDDLIVMPQIESPQGLSNAKAIAAHPLTTALAIGPYDLSCRLGCAWRPDDPALRGAIDQLRAVAESEGKPFWMIGDGNKLAAQGHRFLCIAEPIGLLQTSLNQLVKAVHSNAEGSNNQLPSNPS